MVNCTFGWGIEEAHRQRLLPDRVIELAARHGLDTIAEGVGGGGTGA